MENTFCLNLKYLRKKNGKTQSELASEFGKTNTAISNWEKKLTEPSISELLKISRYFGISTDDLLISDLAKGNLIEKSQKKDNDQKGNLIGNPSGNLIEEKEVKNTGITVAEGQKLGYHFGAPKVVVARNDGNENIVHVAVRARAGYLNGYGDAEYIESLPSYSLPGLKNATFRSFEVEGHSMKPTLLNHDYVVGEWCESADDIREGRVHIIVTHSMGVVIKRVLNRIKDRGKLYLKSDNIVNKDEYPTIHLDPEDIKEIWYARLRFTPDFSEPGQIYNRLNELEIMMYEMNNRLNSL
ncbi:putative HTH-type transcriptional regulator [compost metagenome]